MNAILYELRGIKRRAPSIVSFGEYSDWGERENEHLGGCMCQMCQYPYAGNLGA